MSLPQSESVTIKTDGNRIKSEYTYWQDRYYHAFTLELQTFIDNIKSGERLSPSAWDGYIVAEIADACIRSQSSGAEESVNIITKPKFYK